MDIKKNLTDYWESAKILTDYWDLWMMFADYWQWISKKI